MTRYTKHLYIGKFLLAFGIIGSNLFMLGYAQTNNGSFADYGTAKPLVGVPAAPSAPTTPAPTTTVPDNRAGFVSTNNTTNTSSCTYASCKAACIGNSVCEKQCLSCKDAPSSNSTAPVTCASCKESFCAKETISCDKAKAEAACKKECATPTVYKPSMGITMNPDCLKNGQCGFNIYELLGINRDTSATLFVQDILLSATFFIGTVITIALIYSGIMFIMAGATGKDPSNAKNGIKYSIIGLLTVITSYSLIRLIQYIAKGL